MSGYDRQRALVRIVILNDRRSAVPRSDRRGIRRSIYNMWNRFSRRKLPSDALEIIANLWKPENLLGTERALLYFPVVVTCKFWWKMADKKNNNAPNTSANLLFSAAPEFNFNLPFMPVSQATGPVVLSGGKLKKKGEKNVLTLALLLAG